MSYTPTLDPIFTGNVRVPTATGGDSSQRAASTAFVSNAVSDALTGLSSEFVDLTTAQTIDGDKTIVGNTTFDGEVNGGGVVVYHSDFNWSQLDATSQIFNARVDGESVIRLQVLADGTIKWGDGSGPLDTTLYRLGGNALKTDGTLIANHFGAPTVATGGLTVNDGSVNVNNSVITVDSSANASVMEVYVGDPNSDPTTFVINSDGSMFWGDGVSAGDTGLYRVGVNKLKTDGTFEAAPATVSAELATLGQVEDAVAAIDLSAFAVKANNETIDGLWTFTNNVVLQGALLHLDGATAIRHDNAAAQTTILEAGATGDINFRFTVTNEGEMSFGNGTDAADVSFGRAGANLLAIGADDNLALTLSPTDALHATNKAYVDGVAQGLQLKEAVRAASTGNLTLANEQTVDGVALVAGDRVLAKNQTAGEDNGIYVVVDGGAWTRAADLDEPAELTSGIFTFVEEGTTNGDSGWVVTTNNPIVLGTDPVTWTQFSGAGQITAGDGLGKDGNNLYVGQGLGISVGADAVSVDPSYVMTLGTAQTVTGAKTFTDNISLTDGDGIVWSDIALYRDSAAHLALTGALGVSGALTAASVAATGAITGATLATTGNATVGGTLTVNGTSDFNAAVNMDAGLTVTAGGATIAGGLTSSNQLNVNGTLTANAKLVTNAGVNAAVVTKTANYTINLATDHIILVDTAAAAGGVTLTLPANHDEGDMIVVKDSGGQAETKVITIDPADADLIDGSSSVFININYMGVTLVSNGTNWFLV